LEQAALVAAVVARRGHQETLRFFQLLVLLVVVVEIGMAMEITAVLAVVAVRGIVMWMMF
jgi:hypothetical protein